MGDPRDKTPLEGGRSAGLFGRLRAPRRSPPPHRRRGVLPVGVLLAVAIVVVAVIALAGSDHGVNGLLGSHQASAATPDHAGGAHDPDGAPRPDPPGRHDPAVGEAVGHARARIAAPAREPGGRRRVEHERGLRVLHARLDARAVHLLQAHDPGRDPGQRADAARQDQDDRADGRLPAREGAPAGARAARVSALHVPLPLRCPPAQRRGEQEHGRPPRLPPGDGRARRQLRRRPAARLRQARRDHRGRADRVRGQPRDRIKRNLRRLERADLGEPARGRDRRAPEPEPLHVRDRHGVRTGDARGPQGQPRRAHPRPPTPASPAPKRHRGSSRSTPASRPRR